MRGVHSRVFDVPGSFAEAALVASTRLDRWALARIQQSVGAAPIRFELWDGFGLTPAHPAVGSILFRNRLALYSWVWDPDLNFGEAYMSGAVEIHGDLLALLEAIYRARPVSTHRPWWRWNTTNDARAARQNVHHHYDLGNEFYRLWLDREMVYTCAFYPTPDATLEEAQTYGRRGPRDIPYGSVAAHLLTHLAAPLLVFRERPRRVIKRLSQEAARRVPTARPPSQAAP